MRSFPPEGFLEFISPATDRFRFIVDRLTRLGLNPEIVSGGGARNIVASFAPAAGMADGGSLCLSAHYDRDRRSPGANDNSAACFELLEFCSDLLREPGPHSTLVAFTDTEELAASSGYQAQGAYVLAAAFAGKPLPWVFSLDCCGRGDVLILSTSPYSAFRLNGAAPQIPFIKLLDPLQAWTRGFLAARRPEAWRELPTPYSETLGYLAAGVPAVALTLLPRAEAELFARELAETPVIEHILLKREFRTEAGKLILSRALPETWRRLHGPTDDVASLEAGAFDLIRATLQEIKVARLPTFALT
jgi:hypothetical protein